ncbi:MAG: DUF1007 family protein [Gammaproteobacteria bacterium]
MSLRGTPAWRACILAATTVIVMAAPSQAMAHPHAWIDVEVQVRFDSAARIAALRMTWLFDEIYSAYVTQGLTFSGADAIDARRSGRILAVMMKNLARFHYMTRAEAGTEAMEFGAPTESAIAFKGRRLELSFTLPFATPVPSREVPVAYSVYDPTYYIEMLHAEDAGAIRLVNAPADCRYTLHPPQPDPARVREAAALDRTQSAGNGLGVFFAERVTIRCDRPR